MLYNITQHNMRFDLCIDQWRWAIQVHDPQLQQWANFSSLNVTLSHCAAPVHKQVTSCRSRSLGGKLWHFVLLLGVMLSGRKARGSALNTEGSVACLYETTKGATQRHPYLMTWDEDGFLEHIIQLATHYCRPRLICNRMSFIKCRISALSLFQLRGSWHEKDPWIKERAVGALNKVYCEHK